MVVVFFVEGVYVMLFVGFVVLSIFMVVGMLVVCLVMWRWSVRWRCFG